MGSDVYISWKGMTKKEKDARITGFSIDAGNAGYLRASIGMVNENGLLRELFPDKYWKGGKEREYDFSDEGYYKLEMLGWKYLVYSVMGVEVGDNKGGELLFQTLKAGLNKGEMLDSKNIVMPKSKEFRYAVMWLNSVFGFYELGMKKQKEGLKPKVYISW